FDIQQASIPQNAFGAKNDQPLDQNSAQFRALSQQFVEQRQNKNTFAIGVIFSTKTKGETLGDFIFTHFTIIDFRLSKLVKNLQRCLTLWLISKSSMNSNNVIIFVSAKQFILIYKKE